MATQITKTFYRTTVGLKPLEFESEQLAWRHEGYLLGLMAFEEELRKNNNYYADRIVTHIDRNPFGGCECSQPSTIVSNDMRPRPANTQPVEAPSGSQSSPSKSSSSSGSPPSTDVGPGYVVSDTKRVTSREHEALHIVRSNMRSGSPMLSEFLSWISDRLVKLGESEQTDFVLSLRRYAAEFKKVEELLR